MKPLVIDASIAIKWFIPEDGSVAAIRLFSNKRQMLAPDLIRPEFGNIIWKLHRRRLLKIDEAYQIMNDFLTMPLEIHDNELLIMNAYEIAVETASTVYDSLYLALAVKTGGTMVTADRRLANTLKNTSWEPFIRVIE